jgi:uncharacterized protein
MPAPSPHARPLDENHARGTALRAQGLHEGAAFGEGLDAARRALEHLGYVQIDTIAVVERAHHHVLWSRVPDYRPVWMDELIRAGMAYEYWSHAASVMPMRDFRFSLPLMRHHQKELHWSDDTPELRRTLRRVREVIRDRGPVRLRDFENKSPAGSDVWGFGKIERRALHELWMRGTIMITERGGFEKMYDLRERVLPPDIDTSLPSPNEWADFVIRRTLRAHGIARESEFHYLQRGTFATAVRERLARAVKRSEVVPVLVGGSRTPAYAFPETLEAPPPPITARVQILSPFDNLVIQRERLRWLFGFDYQLECYVPPAKRRYGHFVLPVLYGDRFAARLEAKARRAESVLDVANVWYEPGFEEDRTFHESLREELKRFAAFNGCRELKGAMNGEAK